MYPFVKLYLLVRVTARTDTAVSIPNNQYLSSNKVKESVTNNQLQKADPSGNNSPIGKKMAEK